jgi:hypothetical protein
MTDPISEAHRMAQEAIDTAEQAEDKADDAVETATSVADDITDIVEKAVEDITPDVSVEKPQQESDNAMTEVLAELKKFGDRMTAIEERFAKDETQEEPPAEVEPEPQFIEVKTDDTTSHAGGEDKQNDKPKSNANRRSGPRRGRS